MRQGYTNSAWCRFRMTLWGLRYAVLGAGPWLMATNDNYLARLQNSPRKRQPAVLEFFHQ